MPQQPPKAPAFLSFPKPGLWLPLLVLAALSTTVFADNPGAFLSTSVESPSAELKQQRELYQQAQQAYRKNQHKRFLRLSAQLRDYPLYPYLEYDELIWRMKHRPASLTGALIDKFLLEHDETVIGDRFRLQLIKYAARIKNWRALIDVYRPGFGKTAQCLYLNALIHTGQSELAYPEIENIWLSATSLPRSCDPVFKNWQAAGYKTTDRVWQRFKLAISAGNRQLARFLVKSLPADEARVARKWLRVHRRPELITQPDILNLKHPEQTAILLHGLKRLVYKDLDLAIDNYQKLRHYPFSEQQLAEIHRRIGLQLARKHLPEAGLWLSHIPQAYADKQVREWRIRTAIRQGDWSYVLRGISQLSLNEQNSFRWQFWWAYANEELGKTIDATGIYQYLASKRSFYGFLAADRLNLPYAFEDRPVEPSDDAMRSIREQPETLRAREFYAMQQTLAARREWQRLINRIDTEEKLAASKLAQSWNWHDRAIITMGRTRYRDDIELRFPLPLDSKVNAWSSLHNIEPAWTYAIIRRESAFMPDARSPVGALGLMQLMPNTARRVARQMKIRYHGRHSLLTSNTNIRLGTGYLERMLDKLDSQQVLATAAYNAGPGRVTEWLPEHRTMDAIRWIETIPFTETREYVSNVLAYMAIYEHRMQRQVTRLSQRMPPVPAKNPIPLLPVDDGTQTAQNLKKTSKDPT